MHQSILLVCLIAVALPARAEDLTGRWGVSGLAMGDLTLGQKTVRDQDENIGHDFGAMIRYGLNPHWSAAASYESIRLRKGAQRVAPLDLQAIYSFRPDSRWTPTALFGVGDARGIDSKKYDSLSAKLGLGLEYFMTPNWSLAGQANYHYVSELGEPVRHAHVATLGAVLSYFFGGERAPAPEPRRQVAARPPDSDGDGVPDSQDLCPKTPRGHRVNDKGCEPKAAAPAPAPQTKKVSIELRVLFQINRDQVRPEYEGELAQVARFMRKHPKATAEIEGHTDNVGSAALNTDLSQRRAEAVRTVLIRKYGVAGNRLSAKGYGPDQPVATNKTAVGRRKNRRVVATFSAAEAVE